MSLLTAALKAHYLLNDNAATDVVIDQTSSHNGTISDVGGTATTAFHTYAGRINRALDFDGVDDFISIASHDDFSPVLTPFSISAWCQLDAAANFVVANKTGGLINREWVFANKATAEMACIFYDGVNNANYLGRTTSITLTAYQGTGQWLHLVVTYNGGTTNASVRLYFNGDRVDTADYSSGAFTALANLGAAVNIGSGGSTNGRLDNVMFFNIELTADDVVRLYNNGCGTEMIAEIDSPRRPVRRYSPSFMSLRAGLEK